VIRHRRAIPQFVSGHADRIAAVRRETRATGPALAGNWLDAVGLDGAIASGRLAGNLLRQDRIADVVTALPAVRRRAGRLRSREA
jgi:protoporphyrinogen oxidase